MNVVAKSTPILKSTSTAVPNGLRPVISGGFFLKTKPVVASAPLRINSISDTLLCRPLRVSSGIAVSTQAVQKRLSHTDIKFPDFSDYRRKSLESPTASNKNTELDRKLTTYVLSAVCLTGTIYTAKALVHTLVISMSASADVLALSKIEIDVSTIPEGQSAVFKWQGKPVFVRHRAPAEIQKEASVDITQLRDPQADIDRVQKPEWLIVIGVCTHLGCVPIANAGEFGGYYCPCHGSHYDASGRIRKGPAPLNLEVPTYKFLDSSTVVIG